MTKQRLTFSIEFKREVAGLVLGIEASLSIRRSSLRSVTGRACSSKSAISTTPVQ